MPTTSSARLLIDAFLTGDAPSVDLEPVTAFIDAHATSTPTLGRRPRVACE
jgi:hypothetical protein